MVIGFVLLSWLFLEFISFRVRGTARPSCVESIEEYLEVHHIYRDGAINMEEALQSMAEVGVHFVIVEPNNDEDEDDDEDEEDNEDEDDPNPTTAPAA